MKSEVLYKMAQEEYSFGRDTRAKLLNALGYILKEAENPGNEKVYFTTKDMGHGVYPKGIVICDIGALSGMLFELGSDFNPEYVLSGMQAVTQDYDGYCMSVLTTNDLYSATIDDLSELVFRIRMINN